MRTLDAHTKCAHWMRTLTGCARSVLCVFLFSEHKSAAPSPSLAALSLHAGAAADAPMVDAPGAMADAPGLMVDAARASIHAAFVAKYGPPNNKIAQDLLAAYIEELITTLNGKPHEDKHIAQLFQLVGTALKMIEQVAARALIGPDGQPLDGGSTGPSPSENQLGLYKDFKKFVLSRAQGGQQSEDKAKILYLEAHISELQGYLQSNSVERTRLVAKIQTSFLKDCNGKAAMNKRQLAWVRKIGEIKSHEAQLKESREKLGRARVAEAMLREQIARDKKMLKTFEKQEDEQQARVRQEAERKYKEQKARADEKERIAQVSWMRTLNAHAGCAHGMRTLDAHTECALSVCFVFRRDSPPQPETPSSTKEITITHPRRSPPPLSPKSDATFSSTMRLRRLRRRTSTTKRQNASAPCDFEQSHHL